MAEQIVIKAEAYRDAEGIHPLPRLIGPFATRGDALKYMDELGPLWGSWSTAPLFTPEPDGSGSDRG